MKTNRRKFLKAAFVIGTTGVAILETSAPKADWPATSFEPGGLEQTLKRLQNSKPIVETDKIDLNIPEIAENGSLVPVTVTSNLKDIQKIALVVEQNPVPLVIQAQLMPDLEPFLSARLKMDSSSFVFVIAEGEKACYSVKKKVKVTIGGCGG